MNNICAALAASCFITAYATAAHAQSGAPAQSGSTSNHGLVATGKVVDTAQQPQAGVPVEVVGPAAKTLAVTDSKGEWSVYNLPAGTYTARPFHPSKTDDSAMVTFTVKETGFWGHLVGDRSPSRTPTLRID